MPHQCVHCGAFYGDGSKEILSGCVCGSKFFFYLTEEKLKRLQAAKDVPVELSVEEKKQIEEDVREMIGVEEEETPVVMNFESIKVLKPGKYMIDLHNLFNEDTPLVYTLEEGKYIVDLSQKATGKARKSSTRA